MQEIGTYGGSGEVHTGFCGKKKPLEDLGIHWIILKQIIKELVWLGWCGICMQAEALVLQPAYRYHTTPAKPQRNTDTH